MARSFANIYTAVSGTGYQRYIERYYLEKKALHNSDVVNMQIRYWIEAVEKFNNLAESDYEADTIEEGILIVNLLANSLLVLGGANWAGSGKVPPLLELYGGDPFDLKGKGPELYEHLRKLNDLYNKLSKHFTLQRARLFSEMTYPAIKSLYRATADIWKFVCHEHHATSEFDHLFSDSFLAIIKPPYFPPMP
jgi:hypothetical protein